MGRRARSVLSRTSPASWAAVVTLAALQAAGIRRLAGVLILAAALAVAGTLAGAVRETDAEMKARLIKLLADASGPQADLLRPGLRQAR